jgi:DMSO/TMAO reductase YedYZ molybdopterin-dependent catalytic subunit
MKNNKNIVYIFIISLFFILCNGGEKTNSIDAMKELTEYKGKKLDSAYSFPENSIKGPQKVDIDTYRLKITGLVDIEKEYTYKEVLSEFTSRKKVVNLYCVEGWDKDILWEGVLVEDILEESGIKPEAKVAIFHSVDGYTTSLMLDYILENDLMLAYRMNGIEMPPARGYPFSMVAEGKWAYKWAKWVEEIELSDDVDYRGFWESRGYSNSADLDEPFYD